MSRRRCLVLSLLLSGSLIPILVGASCPPPAPPLVLSDSGGCGTEDAVSNAVLPVCDLGFVCITMVNTTSIPVEVALYVHDGYDPNYFFDCGFAPECCPEVNAQRFCRCPCQYAEIGEMYLTPPQLFQSLFIWPINGASTTTLKPGLSQVVSIQCQKIKSFGIQVGTPGTALTSPQLQAGVHYRCPLVPLPNMPPGLMNLLHVPCGGTIQYVISDRNNCVSPQATHLTIQPARVSAPCPNVQGGTGT